jgi:hypothetical protein
MRRTLPIQHLALTTLVLTLLVPLSASGALLRPNAAQQFPMLDGGVNGALTYNYNPATQLGLLHMVNTPYLISTAAQKNSEFGITSDTNGTLIETLDLVLDQSGQIVASPLNHFEVRGTIVTPDQTFNGILLEGAPINFGAQDLGAVGIQGSDLFDVNMKVTGGSLASYYMGSAYLRILSQSDSTFSGGFDQSFMTGTPITSLWNPDFQGPQAVPEPAALLTLLAGGAYWLNRRRRTSKAA